MEVRAARRSQCMGHLRSMTANPGGRPPQAGSHPSDVCRPRQGTCSGSVWQQLAQRFEGYKPAEGDERPVEEYLLERAAVVRARSERQIVDAVTAAWTAGISWSKIGQLLGTSARSGPTTVRRRCRAGLTSHPLSEPHRRASVAERIREDMGIIVSRFVGRRVTGMGLLVSPLGQTGRGVTQRRGCRGD